VCERERERKRVKGRKSESLRKRERGRKSESYGNRGVIEREMMKE